MLKHYDTEGPTCSARRKATSTRPRPSSRVVSARARQSSVATLGPLSDVFLLNPFIVFFDLWANRGRPCSRGARRLRLPQEIAHGWRVVVTVSPGSRFLLSATCFVYF